jgi:hypothetical protein
LNFIVIFILVLILISQTAHAQVVIKEKVEIKPQVMLSNSSPQSIIQHVFTYKLTWEPSEYHRGNIRIITCNDDTLNSGWSTSGVTTITFTANGRHHYLFEEQSWSYGSWGTGFLPGRLLQVFVDGVEKYHPQDVLGTYDGVAGSFNLNIDGEICTLYEPGLSIGNIQWAECNGPNWYNTDPVGLQITQGSEYASLHNIATGMDLGSTATLNNKDEIANIILKANESAPSVTTSQLVKLEANINGVVVTSETVYYPDIFEIITDVYPSEITTGEEAYIDINLYNYCAPASDETKINLEIIKGHELASLINPYTDERSDTLTNLGHWWGYMYARVIADGKSSNETDTVIVKVSTTDPNIVPKEVPIYIIPPLIYVYTVPEVLLASDTAEVIIKKRNPDGTLEDFPAEQTFELAVTDECVNGNILVDTTLNIYFENVVQPIYFVAADSIEGGTGFVRLRVGTDLGGGNGASKPSRIIDEDEKYLSEEQKKMKELREGYAKMIEQKKKEMLTQMNKSNENPLAAAPLVSACYIGNYIYNFGYWLGDVALEDYKIEILYPTPNTNEWITGEPRMPEVICKAKLSSFYPGVIKYEWKYIVRKYYDRRSVKNSPICTRTSRSEFQGKSYSDFGSEITEWNVPFDKDSGYFYFKSLQPGKNKNDPLNYIYGCAGETNEWYDSNEEIFTGGDVLITITAKEFHTGKILAKLDTVYSGKIRGLNPDINSIHSYANSNKIKAIMWQEGKTNHFTGEAINPFYWWPYNEEGWPLYGKPNGYGLMQLDNGPAATERQLWNWKANVDGGKKKLNAAYNEVFEYHGVPDEGKYNLTNAFQNYNWGNGTKYYVWKKRKKEWVPNPNRGSEYGKKVYDKYIEFGGGN